MKHKLHCYTLLFCLNFFLSRVARTTNVSAYSPNNFQPIPPQFPSMKRITHKVNDDLPVEDDLHLMPFHQVIGAHLFPTHSHRCEPISLPLCKDMYYHETRMPNMFQHETQEEAGLEAHQFYPLVQINCSEDLRFFLCSLYTPICIKAYPNFLPPCRSVCKRVRAGCAPVMEHYRFPWPQRLNCEQFPEYENADQVLCMERNLTEFDWRQEPGSMGHEHQLQRYEPNTTLESTVSKDETRHLLNEMRAREAEKIFLAAYKSNQSVGPILEHVHFRCTCDCRVITGGMDDLAEEPNHADADCELPCRPRRPADDHVRTTTIWFALWSSICAISTGLTILTFCVNSAKFPFTQLIIVYLSGCYFMLSLAYLLRTILGHDPLACSPRALNSGNETLTTELRIKTFHWDRTGRVGCASVFVLGYFFQRAAEIWWVILTFTLFLIKRLNWELEAVRKYSQVYHFVTWSLPTGLTAISLITEAVEGDLITGLCTVSPRRRLHYITLQFIPKILSITVGFVFLTVGCFTGQCWPSWDKIRKRGSGENTRAVMFAWFYFLIQITFLISNGIDLQISYQVALGSICDCQFLHTSELSTVTLPDWNAPSAAYKLVMANHFANLSIGISSFLWIWSRHSSNPLCMLCNWLKTRRSTRTSGLLHLLTERDDQELSSERLLMPTKSSVTNKNSAGSCRDSSDSEQRSNEHIQFPSIRCFPATCANSMTPDMIKSRCGQGPGWAFETERWEHPIAITSPFRYRWNQSCSQTPIISRGHRNWKSSKPTQDSCIQLPTLPIGLKPFHSTPSTPLTSSVPARIRQSQIPRSPFNVEVYYQSIGIDAETSNNSTHPYAFYSHPS